MDYFSDAVDEVLGEYLASFGFSRTHTSSTRVTYRRDRILVSFAYFIEDLPSPWVAIDVGLVGPDGTPHMAGLWRALPDDDPARGYTAWRFVDRASLEEVLRRVATEVLPIHGRRLWESERAIEALLAEQADEAETRYLEERRRVELRRARRAYDEGRFQEAVDNFVLVDPGTLSAANRRLLYDARKQARDVNLADE